MKVLLMPANCLVRIPDLLTGYLFAITASLEQTYMC